MLTPTLGRHEWETYRNYTRMVVGASVKLCEVDYLWTQVLLHILLRDQVLLHKHQKSCLCSLPHLNNMCMRHCPTQTSPFPNRSTFKKQSEDNTQPSLIFAN